MFISNSTEQTRSAGAEAARAAKPGDVFALTGDLGAGKTQFAKGFVAACGSHVEVTSPTFTLLHEYTDGRLPIYHFDFYRIERADELIQLGFDDYVEGDGVCLIEWADKFRQLLPARSRWIAFRVGENSQRIIEEAPNQ